MGSRSIKATLADYLIKQERSDQAYTPTVEDAEKANLQYVHHVPLKELAHLAQSHYVFTLVRNPLRSFSSSCDRIVSAVG